MQPQWWVEAAGVHQRLAPRWCRLECGCGEDLFAGGERDCACRWGGARLVVPAADVTPAWRAYVARVDGPVWLCGLDDSRQMIRLARSRGPLTVEGASFEPVDPAQVDGAEREALPFIVRGAPPVELPL